MLIQALQFISASAFFFYGPYCWFSSEAKREFARYGLVKFRNLIGTLETLGALGLGVGFWSRPLTALSSGGLATLMLLGIVVRLRLRDPFYVLLPALVLFFLNTMIFLSSI